MNSACNVGPIDRTLRILVGALLLVLAFTSLGVTEGALGGILAAFGGCMLLLTGITRFCPAYVPLKISTTGCCKGK